LKNYYKILEVDRNSSKDDIKLAFRKLARQYHPDSNIGNNNFTEIMQDINDAYSILRDETKRAKYNRDYDFTFGKSQYKSEEPKKEKPKEEPKREKAKQKTEQPKKEQRNLDQYIWDGSNPNKYDNYSGSFEKFKNMVIYDLEKGEFEKTEIFNLRKKIVESELLNDYLGSQKVEMVYDADSEKFQVTINKSLTFLISIPNNIAQVFKNSVKSFQVKFSKYLRIIEISVNFRGVKYIGTDFDSGWKIERGYEDRGFSEYKMENAKERKKSRNIGIALILAPIILPIILVIILEIIK